MLCTCNWLVQMALQRINFYTVQLYELGEYFTAPLHLLMPLPKTRSRLELLNNLQFKDTGGREFAGRANGSSAFCDLLAHKLRSSDPSSFYQITPLSISPLLPLLDILFLLRGRKHTSDLSGVTGVHGLRWRPILSGFAPQ
ncbi:hypothetical protein EVAR_92174_1 [Eumeta japonica]|uniref:Uncharacterized protein n=1 Tax=Eumeta variegata TaxID=151549 RepID=A0A4C1SZF3_EUMVA|nr:hypothetical protein EVAR_92174_1 [Eumeta japonica]